MTSIFKEINNLKKSEYSVLTIKNCVFIVFNFDYAHENKFKSFISNIFNNKKHTYSRTFYLYIDLDTMNIGIPKEYVEYEITYNNSNKNIQKYLPTSIEIQFYKGNKSTNSLIEKFLRIYADIKTY